MELQSLSALLDSFATTLSFVMIVSGSLLVINLDSRIDFGDKEISSLILEISTFESVLVFFCKLSSPSGSVLVSFSDLLRFLVIVTESKNK